MQAEGKQQSLRTDWKVEQKVNADYSGSVWRKSDGREMDGQGIELVRCMNKFKMYRH